MDKHHLGEMRFDHGARTVRWNPVRMNQEQARFMARVYNFVADLSDDRVVIDTCAGSLCCVPEDADISEREYEFIDVLDRGVVVSG